MTVGGMGGPRKWACSVSIQQTVRDTKSAHERKPREKWACSTRNDATWQLLVNRAAKTEDVAAVVGDLEGAESIAGIGQFPMHGNLFANELCEQ